MSMEIRNQGGKPKILRDGQRTRVAFATVGPSMAKQQFKRECDVNHIMEKYEKKGIIEHFNKYQGSYEDVTGAVSYHEAMIIIAEAEEAFMTLPAATRSRFGNDPGAFLDFVDDEANLDEMVELGLAKRPESPAPGAQPEGEQSAEPTPASPEPVPEA